MIQTKNKTRSLIFLFYLALAAFEVFVRIPYAIIVAQSDTASYTLINHFFANFDANLVIAYGSLLLFLSLFTLFVCNVFTGLKIKIGASTLPKITSSIYPIVIASIAASIYVISSLGNDALLDDISSKRDIVEDGEYFNYFVFKLANFSHFVIALMYIKIHQQNLLQDKVLTALLFLSLVAVLIVFSNRATLVTLALELMYIQLIFGKLNFQAVVRIAAYVLPILLAVAFLRAYGTNDIYSFWEATKIAIEKIVTSRYFLDVPKLGSTYLWSIEETWLGPVSVNFLVEPFIPDSVIYYKELGPILAGEVYQYLAQTGVTPGLLLESIISFRLFGGLLFFAMIMLIMLKLEKLFLMSSKRKLFYLLAIGKTSILINSSLGAFAFQLALEGVFLICVVTYFRLSKALFKIR